MGKVSPARAAVGAAILVAIIAAIAVASSILWRRKQTRNDRASSRSAHQPSKHPSNVDLDTHVDLPGYIMMPDHVVGGKPGPKKIPLGRFDNPHEAKQACDGTADLYACQYIVHVKKGEDRGAWIAYALVDVPLERVTHHIVSDYGTSDTYVRVG